MQPTNLGKTANLLPVEIEGLQVMEEIRPEYFKHIIDENTREKSLLE